MAYSTRRARNACSPYTYQLRPYLKKGSVPLLPDFTFYLPSSFACKLTSPIKRFFCRWFVWLKFKKSNLHVISFYLFQTLCSCVAGFLHYLFLASFSWMCIEGIHLYMKIVRVYRTESMRMMYCYVFGWGESLVCHYYCDRCLWSVVCIV
jgi:hypothetical protein